MAKYGRYQKKVRLEILESNLAVPQGTSGTQTIAHRWDDSGLLIGATNRIAIGVPDGVPFGPGIVDAYGALSLSGVLYDEGIIQVLQHRMVMDFEAFGMAAELRSHIREVLMFPEGHGIPFDEGDFIYAIVYGRDAMLTSGQISAEFMSNLYWLEKI